MDPNTFIKILSKNIWLPVVTWKAYILHTAQSEFPAQWFLLGQQRESIKITSAICGASSQPNTACIPPAEHARPLHANCSEAPAPPKWFIVTYSRDHHINSSKYKAARTQLSKKINKTQHQGASETDFQVWSPLLEIGWACSTSSPTAVNISARNIFGFSPSLNIHAIGNTYMK